MLPHTVTPVEAASVLSAAGVHVDDVPALAALATTGVVGNLVVLASPDGDPAPEAARRLAELLLTDPQSRALDVHLAVPAGDRWTVDELDELVLGPARLRAFERTHVVVVDADAMAPAAADHLLKTLEEPSSAALFWFCVRDAATLKATLRGRAAAVLPARAAPASARVDALVAEGADPQSAAEVAALAGADLRLARAALADPALLPPLRLLAGAPLVGVAGPTAAAFALVEAVAALAAATTRVADGGKPRRTRKAPTAAKPKPKNPWSALADEHRPAARRLLRRLLDRWRAELPAAVAAAGTAAELAAAARAAAALESAGAELATHASPVTVLAALLARSA